MEKPDGLISATALPVKLCDSCKSASANVFCRPDSAFLCSPCDTKIHTANKLASRHARVSVCDVCEQAPATLTCKADSAHLCAPCDREIHSANPLASRHERVPISPLVIADTHEDTDNKSSVTSGIGRATGISKLFDDEEYNYDDDIEASMAEAASWILHSPNPNLNSKPRDYKVMPDPNSIDYELLFADDDLFPNLDLEFSWDPNSAVEADCVVPDTKESRHQQVLPQAYFSRPSSFNQGGLYNSAKNHNPFSLSDAQPHVNWILSSNSSAKDVELVPDPSATRIASKAVGGGMMEKYLAMVRGKGVDREARVKRYMEKRKNRKFEKTIRYASRKAYAETRPRIKGRFTKQSEMKQQSAGGYRYFAAAAAVEEEDDGDFGVVPSIVC